VRLAVKVDGLPKAEWVWLPQYEDWIRGKTLAVRHALLARALLPAAAAYVGVAVIIWLVPARHCFSNGCLLAVAGHKVPFCSRLCCMHEVFLATELQVPVVFANTLACTGSCDSQKAKCARQCDEDLVRKDIEASDGQGYDRINRAVRAALWRHRWVSFLKIIKWAVLLALLCSADRRITFAANWETAQGALDVHCASVLGIFSGVLLGCSGLYFFARQASGRPRCWMVLTCDFLLIGVAAAVTVAFMHWGSLRREFPKRWPDALDILSSDCFGYLNVEDQAGLGCSRRLAFCGALSQTLLAAGLLLAAHCVGSLCCPARLRRCPAAVLAMTLAAASLASAVHQEPGLPAGDFAFSVALFYCTRASARVLAPVLAMRAAASCWGIRSSCGHRRPRAAKRPASPDSACSDPHGARSR